jgi:tRNA pseudouridine38-40 synthase
MPPWRASSSSRAAIGAIPLSLFADEAGPAAAAAVTAGPTERVRLLVAYHGAGFHGFALQRGVPTVGGALSGALERGLRHTVELTCAGRTDAGVHAWGQVVSFDARVDVDVAGLVRSVNRALHPQVVVRAAEVGPEGFDARRWATSRRYRYLVRNHPEADPFTAGTAWHVARRLDLRSMRLASDPLLGEHDFSSFCRRPPAEGGSLVRLVREARWVDLGGGMLRFEIEASSFCQQMVRALVGTLVDVGAGKRRAGDMTGVIRARSRAAAGQLAPPHGLCLWEVGYPPDRGSSWPSSERATTEGG